MTIIRPIQLAALLFALLAGSAGAQSSAFTYQGQLREAGQPFTGMADLEFRLYDQLAAGNQIGNAQSLPDWPVENGLFQVELDFGVGAFDGSDRFLAVTVDGAPLIPRQKITATPIALLAAGLASGSVGGGSVDPTEIQLRVVGTCPPGEYVQGVNQDGSVVCGVDGDSGGTVTRIDTGAGLTGGPITEAGTLSIAPGGVGATEIDSSQVQRRVFGSCVAGSYIWGIEPDGTVGCAPDATGNDWRLGGNTGTDPANDFLGTTDASALEIRTNNARSLRIEPSTILFDSLPITANVIAGSSANEIADGVRGSTIVGGGMPELSDPNYGSDSPNRINASYSTIGGGFGNTIGEFGTLAIIGGGLTNTISNAYATIGGGWNNTASGDWSAIAGGRDNIASGTNSAVTGGSNNKASGLSSVASGQQATASEFGSAVAGGLDNTASGRYSAVSGGFSNCAGGFNSWAGGFRAKVRPGTGSGEPGVACTNVPLSEDFDGDEGTFIWADNGGPDVVSSGPNQFLVRASGGIGFGRTPDDFFEIETPFDQIPGDGSGEQGALRVRLNGSTRLRLLANGGLAIGSSYRVSGVPENGLRVAGRVRLGSLGTAGSTSLCRNTGGEIATCSSSARYKHAIDELDLGLDTLLALRPVSYRWNADDLADIGFVAEEVAAVDERLINRNVNGEIEGVRYDRISAVLANAVNEMDHRYRSHGARLAALTDENRALRTRLASVERRHREQLDAMEEQRQREFASMRRELGVLRELISPRVAQEVQQ